ncbi:MAG: xanthine dehydrogenase family protein molybdopterin-binding subunit [Hyphomicrobiaceae bacterium]
MGTNADYQGRIEDDRFITGQGRYVADLAIPNLTHAYVVRSPFAHATLNAVDTTASKDSPGVLAVYTAADLAADGIGDQPSKIAPRRPNGDEAFPAGRRVLARDAVRHLGEPVALVIAETRAAAVNAGELVEINADEHDVVTNARLAQEPEAQLVWPAVANNVAYVWSKGDFVAVDAALQSATHVTRLNTHVTRVMTNSMEPRGVLAYVADDGRLTVHPSSQNPYAMRTGLAAMLGLPVDQLRVIGGDVGGSFGMKSGVYPEDILVSWATRKLGRPVRWIADRTEGFLADEHGRDVQLDIELGLDADHNFTALRVTCHVNIGAYLSGRSLFMIGNFGGIAGVYRIGQICGEVRGVHTHTQVTSPYRGAGRPEATFAIERVIDLAAREVGVDPFELRRRNVIPPEAMPYDTGFTFLYDCGEFDENMTTAARMIDRDGFETRRSEARGRGKYRGLGMSNPIEVAGGPFVKPGKDNSRLHVSPNGKVTLYSGIMSVGQGTETAFSHLVAERLGISVDDVVYRQGDTDMLESGRGNGGSSATPVGASSVSVTIDNLIDVVRPLAAEMLQTARSGVEFSNGEFRTAGTASSVRFGEVARYAGEKNPQGLEAEGEFDPPGVTFPNGCHMCEVEIDPDTGSIDIVNYCVCEDIGTVLNPTLAQGQMHGGIVQGAGQALLERAVHDPDSGQLLSGSFMDYTMPRADDFSGFTFATRAVPTMVNPVGAKGIGEAGTVGSIAATINAVCDALSPLGINHIEMPATPDRIWTAIQEAKGHR